MRKATLSLIVFSLTAGPAMADQQDDINDIRKLCGRLREYVVVVSPLVNDRAEAAKIKQCLYETLDLFEERFRCNATKMVEIDSNYRAITVTFVSKTSPVISFIVVAKNDNLILEQATIGGFRVVDADPYGLNR
jgi:hypothetical protein